MFAMDKGRDYTAYSYYCNSSYKWLIEMLILVQDEQHPTINPSQPIATPPKTPKIKQPFYDI